MKTAKLPKLQQLQHQFISSFTEDALGDSDSKARSELGIWNKTPSS